MNLNHWIKATGSIGRNLATDLRHPSKRGFAFTRTWPSQGLDYDNRLRVPEVSWQAFCPQASSLTVPVDVQYRYGNVSPLEIYCLAALAVSRKALRIFEMGTFDGATALALASACPAALVFTLELPPGREHAASAPSITDRIPTGDRFHGTPQSARITQLYGDSTRFDFSRYHARCDLIFIDAGHDYRSVRSDSRNALRMVRPGGIILWHDYMQAWPGVKKAVEELLPQYPIVRIQGTCLAALDMTRKRVGSPFATG
jgi:predicted O-methyltransferase YrrM